jgi:hypothetical protein
MKSFEPLITHDPSRSSAVVRVAPASEPACRLREAESGEAAPRGEVREPALLLLVGAEEQDRHRAERGVGRDGDRDGGVDACELLDRDGVGDRVSARAAVPLGHRKPHQPELAQVRHELVGKASAQVELRGERLDALPCERSDRVADQLLLGSEVEVHAALMVVAL